MFYVYKITNKVNGKVYIGKTDNVRNRWLAHTNISRHPEWKTHSLIHKAIHKYGADSFIVETIEEYNSEQDALDKEEYWIESYKTNVAKYGNEYGYNLTAGGEGTSGYKFSKEQRKKMSEDRIGEGNAFYGKKHSKETIRHLSNYWIEYYTTHSAPNLGVPVSNETKKKLSESHIGLYDGNKNPMFGRVRTEEEKNKIRKTRKENESTYNYPKGSDKSQSKLTEKDVESIYSMIMDGITDQKIADNFIVSRKVITAIRLGKVWKHVPRPSNLTDGRKKLTKELVIKILKLISNGIDNLSIANQFDTSPRSIQRIRTGEIWKSIPR